jgi:hypothetical protein
MDVSPQALASQAFGPKGRPEFRYHIECGEDPRKQRPRALALDGLDQQRLQQDQHLQRLAQIMAGRRQWFVSGIVHLTSAASRTPASSKRVSRRRAFRFRAAVYVD